MKRLLTSIALGFALLLAVPAAVRAESAWYLQVAKPASPLHTRSFNIQYTVLATDEAAFTVQLFQDGALVGTQATDDDPNAANGNSGAFPVTVANDGTYTYTVKATPKTGGSAKTATTTATVDATTPTAPSYGGKTQNGTTYVITFTAPNGDVKSVQIFASTSPTFTVGTSTLVGEVSVTPGQKVTFRYDAPDTKPRYFAIRSVDGSGNYSSLVGDPDVVTSTSGATQATGDGVTAGQVEASGSATDKDNTKDSDKDKKEQKDVLGSDDSERNWWPWIILAGLLALGGYFYYRNRETEK